MHIWVCENVRGVEKKKEKNNKMTYIAKEPRPPPMAFSVPNRNTS